MQKVYKAAMLTKNLYAGQSLGLILSIVQYRGISLPLYSLADACA